jgi:hypothetical protein
MLVQGNTVYFPTYGVTYFYCNRFFVTLCFGLSILTYVEDTHTAGS